MSNKAKGSKAEREVFDMFIQNHFRAVRVAGSGAMENADCDIIAGKKGDGKYAIEAKSSKKPVKYITKEQIESFMIFSDIFGLKPVIAVRFNRLGWFFLNPKNMKNSGKNWVINEETARLKGKRFSQFFLKENSKKDKKEKGNTLNDTEIIDDYMKDNYIDNDSDEIE
ncbi:MAG: Holliday junction resolvase Hjc [Nanoarchaeota archaeon]